MYLQALSDGFVVLEPGVELLSVDNAPININPGGVRVRAMGGDLTKK